MTIEEKRISFVSVLLTSELHIFAGSDTFILSIGNILTSVIAGFVVFPYIGYLAHLTHQEVKDVFIPDTGLAFIVFPFAATKMAGAPFWSLAFFLMMLSIGIDSQLVSFETIVAAIVDYFPVIKLYKKVFVGLLCAFMYSIGLIYCTQVSFYTVLNFNFCSSSQAHPKNIQRRDNTGSKSWTISLVDGRS